SMPVPPPHRDLRLAGLAGSAGGRGGRRAGRPAGGAAGRAGPQRRFGANAGAPGGNRGRRGGGPPGTTRPPPPPPPPPRAPPARPAHRELLRRLHAEGTLRMSGPFADDSGAFLIFDVPDATALQKIIDDDPYFRTPGVTIVRRQAWSPFLA